MSFNPGGGGGISAASDIAFSNPAQNDTLTFDSAVQKWRNQTLNEVVSISTAWSAGVDYAVGDFFSHGGVIYRTEVAFTSSSTQPSVATARPTDPASNFSVWAAPGNSPGSLVVRSSTNEVTVQMVYIMNVPADPTSGTNKQYVDDKVAEMALQARPPILARVVWNGSDWTYRNVVITARPGDLGTGDGIIFVGNPGGTLPTWAATNDLWTQG